MVLEGGSIHVDGEGYVLWPMTISNGVLGCALQLIFIC